MKLQYIKQDSINGKWKDRKGNFWGYLNVETFQKKTGGKVFLFGDVGKRGKSSDDILNDEDNSIAIYDSRQKLGFFDKIIGYLECKDEDGQTGYVRIVESSKSKMGLLLLLLLLVVGLGTFFITRDTGVKVDSSAIAYEMPGNIKNEDPNSIALPGYSEINLSLSKGKITMPLINPAGNPCYFKYVITMKDTGEVLYESDYIKPGTAIPEYKLSKTLEKGEYDVLVNAKAYDINDYTVPLNGGTMEAVLKVGD